MTTRRIVVFAMSLTIVLGFFSVAHAQTEKAARDGKPLGGKPQSRIIRLLTEGGGCSQLIASLQIKDGLSEVFINDVVLGKGASGTMGKLGFKDYASFRASVTEHLISQASNPTRDTTPSRKPWPWKCVYNCRLHKACEEYVWLEFPTPVPTDYSTQADCEAQEKQSCIEYPGAGWHADVCRLAVPRP
jgi:hypothetical protein